MTTTAAAPSFNGHALPAVTLPPGLNAGSSAASFSSVDDRARPVVCLDSLVRRDLAREEAGVLRGDRALLRLLREPVHVLARDVPALGDVLGRQPHRDVDVRDRRVVAEERRMKLLFRLRVPAHLRGRLDPACDECLALAGLDRVEGHADRLQARRAETVDRRARAPSPAVLRAARRAVRGSFPAAPAGSRSRSSRRRSPRAAAPAPARARRRPQTQRGRRAGLRRATLWRRGRSACARLRRSRRLACANID